MKKQLEAMEKLVRESNTTVKAMEGDLSNLRGQMEELSTMLTSHFSPAGESSKRMRTGTSEAQASGSRISRAKPKASRSRSGEAGKQAGDD